MKNSYRMLLGAMFVAFGVAMQITDTQPIISAAVMAAGLVYMIRGVRIFRRGEEAYKGDERTRKIGAFASAYSWFLTLMAMVVLFWLDYLNVISLTVQYVLGIMIFFIIFSMLGFRWHLARKGDAQ